MNIVTRRILNCHEPAKVLILRLCHKSHCTYCIDSTWKRKTSIAFQRIPEKYKYFTQYRECTSFATKNNEPKMSTTTQFLREHELMYSILRNSVHYADTTMQPIKTQAYTTHDEIEMLRNVDWSSESVLCILNSLKKLAYCHLSGVQFENKTFNDILKACNVQLSNFNNAHIWKLMQYMIVLQNFLRNSDIYPVFMKNLNNECVKRFFSSDVKELLRTTDAFYQLEAVNSSYVWRALRKLGTKPNKLTGKQLVQFLHFLSVYEVPNLNMFEIECSLDNCLSELTPNEIGVAARGFFLNETNIHSKPLVTKIIKRITDNVSAINDISLAAIMKLIRYSNCYHCVKELGDLVVALSHMVPQMPLITLTHIAHAVGAQRFYDKTLMDNIVAKVENEIESARIKDIERVIYAVCTVTPCSTYYDACNRLLNELIRTYKTSRFKEIKTYRKPLPRMLVFLTYKNIYPQELIEYTMNPEYITQMYKHNLNLLSNELLILDCSVKIELPKYRGPFLNDRIYTYLVKKFSYKPDSFEGPRRTQLRADIIRICKEKLKLNVYNDWISPHFVTSDAILGFDQHNNPIPVEPILSKMQGVSIKRVDANHLRHVQFKVLLILSHMQKVTGHDGYIGPVHAKYRQLETLGYTPIPISELKWSDLSTDDNKASYLERRLFQKTSSDLYSAENASREN